MSDPYVHVEFPKWLYRGDKDATESCLVQNIEEQALYAEDGWKTAEEFHVEQSVSENARPGKPKKKDSK